MSDAIDFLTPAFDVETGTEVRLWVGAGHVANEKGDLYGTSPHRIIRWGLVSIAADRAADAVAAGWRMRAEQPEDPDFARLERTEADREAC
jgi:hypothetical protein